MTRFLEEQFGLNDGLIEKVSREQVPRRHVGSCEEFKAFNEWRVVHQPKLQIVGLGFYATSITDQIYDARILSDLVKDRVCNYPLIENELTSDLSHRSGFALCENPVKRSTIVV